MPIEHVTRKEWYLEEAKRCRTAASAARWDDVRQQYLTLAAQWEAMAESAGSDDPSGAPPLQPD
jgi:hypothetical protein